MYIYNNHTKAPPRQSDETEDSYCNLIEGLRIELFPTRIWPQNQLVMFLFPTKRQTILAQHTVKAASGTSKQRSSNAEAKAEKRNPIQRSNSVFMACQSPVIEDLITRVASLRMWSRCPSYHVTNDLEQDLKVTRRGRGSWARLPSCSSKAESAELGIVGVLLCRAVVMWWALLSYGLGYPLFIAISLVAYS